MADEHKTIAKGAFWGIFSQIGIRVIGFFYLILLARFVDPVEAGAFYLGLSIVGVVYTITDFGLVYSNTRYVPYLYGRKEIGKLKWLVRNSYLFGGALTLIGIPDT
ncbi:oligosaccharide flippase family protein [Candidatus Micrarchaeota archaeon]|nr:oligosaccharide flippase family protein [Candidatus Micrarchaeota archaeon]